MRLACVLVIVTLFIGCASSNRVSRIALDRRSDANILEVVRGKDLPTTYQFEWDGTSSYIDASEMKRKTFRWDAGAKSREGDLTCRGYIRLRGENEIEINLTGYEWSGEYRELEINGVHKLDDKHKLK